MVSTCFDMPDDVRYLVINHEKYNETVMASCIRKEGEKIKTKKNLK